MLYLSQNGFSLVLQDELDKAIDNRNAVDAFRIGQREPYISVPIFRALRIGAEYGESIFVESIKRSSIRTPLTLEGLKELWVLLKVLTP